MNINIFKDLEELIRYLNLAISNINNNFSKINDELKKWKSEIEITEVKSSLQMILSNVIKWYDEYKKSGDILCISLKEYDNVSKESSYILGETSLVDDLYSEVIDWIISEIGIEMCNSIKKGGKINE